MPIAVKDTIETRALPTGQGSLMWAGTRTGRDAASVQALIAAGAVLVGKTTTTEFAAQHPFHRTSNPHDARRTAGGSSSGSAAAVAAGMVPFALGTQVIGSILRPASYCGVVGFKPSVGAINRGGSYDHLSQSCQGAIASTLSDAWLGLSVVADAVGGDPGRVGLCGTPDFTASVAPARLAVLQTGGWNSVSRGARAAFEGALSVLESHGVQLVRRMDDPLVERVEVEVEQAKELSLGICDWESRWPLEGYARHARHKLSTASVERLRRGLAMTPADYEALLRRRASARATFAEAADAVDGFVTLGATGSAPLGFESTGDPALNVAGSFLGVPALTLPLLRDGGLPLGLQVLGPMGGDAALFDVAAWIAGGAFGRADLIGSEIKERA